MTAARKAALLMSPDKPEITNVLVPVPICCLNNLKSIQKVNSDKDTEHP